MEKRKILLKEEIEMEGFSDVLKELKEEYKFSSFEYGEEGLKREFGADWYYIHLYNDKGYPLIDVEIYIKYVDYNYKNIENVIAVIKDPL